MQPKCINNELYIGTAKIEKENLVGHCLHKFLEGKCHYYPADTIECGSSNLSYRIKGANMGQQEEKSLFSHNESELHPTECS